MHKKPKLDTPYPRGFQWDIHRVVAVKNQLQSNIYLMVWFDRESKTDKLYISENFQKRIVYRQLPVKNWKTGFLPVSNLRHFAINLNLVSSCYSWKNTLMVKFSRGALEIRWKYFVKKTRKMAKIIQFWPFFTIFNKIKIVILK